MSPKPLHCFGPSWLPTGHVRDVRRLWRASPSSSEKLSKISHCSLRSSGCQWSYLDLEAKHQVMCPWQWTYRDCVGPSSQAKQLWKKVQMSRRTACKWENSSAVNFRKSTMSFRLIRAWEQDKWSSLTSRFVFTLPNLLSTYCKSVPNAWKNRLYVFVNGYIMRSWYSISPHVKNPQIQPVDLPALTVVWLDPRRVIIPSMNSANVSGSPSSNSKWP